MTYTREPYPSDVSDKEWALVAPYLTLLPEDSGQRTDQLREVFSGLPTFSGRFADMDKMGFTAEGLGDFLNRHMTTAPAPELTSTE